MYTIDIDSIVVKIQDNDCDYLESIRRFGNNAGYIIQPIRHGSEKMTKEAYSEWKSIGQKPKRGTLYLAIAHSVRGMKYPVEVYPRSNGITVAYHGLTQYDHDEMILLLHQ
jgi:hypothetical protein